MHATGDSAPFYARRPVAGPTRELPRPLDAAESLKDAAAKAGIYVGAAINYGGMAGGQYSPSYPATALSQFSLFTAENECKWGPIHPQPAGYAYEQCDYLASTSIANKSVFRFHNTAWGNENPGWLNAMKDRAGLTAALQYHIANISQHYLSSPTLSYYAIDVVNEAVSDFGSTLLKPVVPWYPAVPDYLNVAFAAAAAADPAPKERLFCYNDYGAEGASSPKAAKILTLVQQLKAAGAPINCVGLQMHIDVDQHPSGDDVAANIKALGALGMTVHSA